MFSREQLNKVYFADGEGTKHALAEIMATKFPDELGFRMPPKRRAWTSEDSRMDIFDAVALGLMLRPEQSKANAPPIVPVRAVRAAQYPCQSENRMTL